MSMSDTNSNKPVVGGFDIGFAQCKMDVPAFGATVTIPSAVASPQFAKAGFGGGQRLYVFDTGKFVFGSDALVPGAKQLQSLDTYWLLKYFPGFICAVADAGGVDLHKINVLSTGLPIDAWRKHQHLLKESLKSIHCNGEHYVFDRVDVRPQGVGALGYYNSIYGPPANECGLVIDGGGNTVLSVRYDNLRPIATDTREYDQLGMLAIARSITSYLSELSSGRVVSEIKAMKAVHSKTFLGQDITSVVNEAVERHCELLLSSLRADYRDIIPELDRIVVCGGGAYFIGDALKKEYGSKVVVLDNPEYANVKGYVHMSEAA